MAMCESEVANTGRRSISQDELRRSHQDPAIRSFGSRVTPAFARNAAVDEGYTKALSAVLDSNITTLATAAILYFFGSGPIQGFALTLMIGIFMTLFTAIIITRQFVEISLSGGASNFSFGQPKLQD
mgnify:CR=1 FL=1